MTYNLCHQKRIDYLGRIVIPKEICKMAKIECNDNLIITYNEQEDSIILKKIVSNNTIVEIINKIFIPLVDVVNCPIIITDSSKVVEVLGSKKLIYLKGKFISKQLKGIILDQLISSKIMYNLNLTDEYEIDSRCYCITIKENDYNIGCAIIYTELDINKDFLSFILKQVRR